MGTAASFAAGGSGSGGGSDQQHSAATQFLAWTDVGAPAQRKARLACTFARARAQSSHTDK